MVKVSGTTHQSITFTLQEVSEEKKESGWKLFEEIMAESVSSKKRPREEEKDIDYMRTTRKQ